MMCSSRGIHSATSDYLGLWEGTALEKHARHLSANNTGRQIADGGSGGTDSGIGSSIGSGRVSGAS